MQNLLKKLPAFGLVLILTLIASAEASAQASIIILNGDAPGVGFNDTTPATPVGGNTGTTIGEQRLIAFQAAANIWGATLVSGPTITINARWATMTDSCTATSGTLASAGNSGSIWRNFAGAVPGFWYGNALANAISNQDRNGAGTSEINATFNLSLGTPGCLETLRWYYGLDNNHGTNGTDFISVTLHELSHGLGFQTFTNKSTGQQAGDDTNGRFPTIYDRWLFDNTANKDWPQMTDAERVASAINTGNLVWVGPQVLADAPIVLFGAPRFRINSPSSIAGTYQIGVADFGPALSASGITANIVQAFDPADTAGLSTTDACSPLSNAASVAGNIALIDRGTCTFVTKTRNAQNAGAVAVIIVDNDPANNPPPGLGGTDNTIRIPAVRVTTADGNTIKSQLASGVNGSLFSDPSMLAGTDSGRRPLMFAPNPLQGGSSVSHWDTSLTPNQVMEPNIAGNLFHRVSPPLDLTLSLFRDIGWQSNATPAPTIFVEQGTTKAAALDSVTQTRGPFSNNNPHNLNTNGDTRRRLVFFTTDLGVHPTDNLSVLRVFANGIELFVESAGPNSSLPGSSYIVVRLDGLPASPPDYNLTVSLRGVNSTNSPTIQIVP